MAGVEISSGTAEDVMVLESLFIPGTKQTPEISCNKSSGEVVFKGNFISSEPNEILEPIQNWLYNFVKTKRSSGVILSFHLTYLNCTSWKSLKILFQQAEVLQDMGTNVLVDLYYEEDDTDMLDWCKEVKSNFRLQFNLSKVN